MTCTMCYSCTIFVLLWRLSDSFLICMFYALLLAKTRACKIIKFMILLYENKFVTSSCRSHYVFYCTHVTQLLYLKPFWKKSISRVNADTSCCIACINKRISAYSTIVNANTSLQLVWSINKKRFHRNNNAWWSFYRNKSQEQVR